MISRRASNKWRKSSSSWTSCKANRIYCSKRMTTSAAWWDKSEKTNRVCRIPWTKKEKGSVRRDSSSESSKTVFQDNLKQINKKSRHSRIKMRFTQEMSWT